MASEADPEPVGLSPSFAKGPSRMERLIQAPA
jgi:hypothetical protein